jgi:hypothetical protein
MFRAWLLWVSRAVPEPVFASSYAEVAPAKEPWTHGVQVGHRFLYRTFLKPPSLFEFLSSSRRPFQWLGLPTLYSPYDRLTAFSSSSSSFAEFAPFERERSAFHATPTGSRHWENDHRIGRGSSETDHRNPIQIDRS